MSVLHASHYELLNLLKKVGEQYDALLKQQKLTNQLLERILEIEETKFNVEYGRYRDLYDYDIKLAPGEKKLLVSVSGIGRLIDTVVSVTMPDATPPEIQLEVSFDGEEILDWTCEEYYSLLGFRPVPGYGGCTIYDTTLRKYAWWTHWGPFGEFKESLLVYLHNLTDVEVTVDVWDVQLRALKPAEVKMYE
jgi:hypothetical protein